MRSERYDGRSKREIFPFVNNYKSNLFVSGKLKESQDAEFLGWQETPSGKRVALYNVMNQDHPLYHSTVTERNLLRQSLKVPKTAHTNEKKNSVKKTTKQY